MRSATAQKNKGFTLIELLLALTIVTILAVSVFVALNPAQRLEDSKDARRSADVDTILTAIHQSIVDNKGTYPTNMPAASDLEVYQQLGTGDAIQCPAAVGTSCTGMTTTCKNLNSGGQNLSSYLKSLPSDPGTSDNPPISTGYAVNVTTTGIVTVRACYTDGTTVIQASR